MGKSTHASTFNPDIATAAADVSQEHLQTQVDDFGDFIATLESQHSQFQKSLKSLNTSNTTFQNNMTS